MLKTSTTVAALTVSVLAISLGASAVEAAPVSIFDSVDPDLLTVDIGFTANTPSLIEVAAPFTLATTETVTSFNILAYDNGGSGSISASDTYTVAFYDNNGAAPLAAAITSFTATSVNVAQRASAADPALHDVSGSITGMSLAPGSYLFSVFSDNTNFLIGAQAFPASGGSVYTRTMPASPWQAFVLSAQADFELFADDTPAVPLPAGLGLLLTAFGSLSVARRIQRKT